MTFLPAGEDLIRFFESKRLEAYQDPAGIWTIGLGHISGVFPGMKITDEQAESFFRADIDSFCGRVKLRVRSDLSDNQFTAAVCFAFNVRGWAVSPLFALLSAGRIDDAKKHWLLYCHIDKGYGEKIEVPGLLARRQRELALFSES